MKIKPMNIKALDLEIVNRITSLETGKLLSPYYKETMFRVGRNFNKYITEESKSSFFDAVKGFLEKRKSELSAKTFYIRLNALKSLILNQPFLRDLDSDRKKKFKNELNCQFRLKPLVDMKIVRAKATVNNIEPLTLEEINMLIRVSSQRMRLITIFLLSTGCHLREMVELRMDQIHSTNRKEIQRIDMPSKYNQDRIIFVSADLINEIVKVFCPEEWLFETKTHKRLSRYNIRKELQKNSKKAHLKREVTPGLLRDTFAKKLMDNGYSTDAVKYFMGEPIVINVNVTIIDEDVVKLFQDFILTK